MNLDEVLPTFVAESSELLDEMEAALLRFDSKSPDHAAISAIFRAAHTIKGSAGLFGLSTIVDFTHLCESVLDRVRDNSLPLDEDLIGLMLRCSDHLRSLIDASTSDRAPSLAIAMQTAGRPLQTALALKLAQGSASCPPSGDRAVPVAAQTSASAEPMPDQQKQDRQWNVKHWHISLRFGPDVLRNGMDPLSLLRYLGTLGTLLAVEPVLDALPVDPAPFDPESCYLGFEIALLTDVDKARIDSAFDFVRDDCAVRIIPPASRIEQLAVAPDVVPAGRESRHRESRSIRVDADKLDRLIDLVGELITSAASAQIIARRTGATELEASSAELCELVESVRDSAMQLRMVQIAPTFNRFQRVVHDVSRELGKDISLVIAGEDTELDKTVVERIGDPLLHLVRNAIDHGIEPVESRLAKGKPARGTIRLNAFHDSGSVVIEVNDDGGGLDRERILAKATERGLAESGRQYTDAEVYDLVFEPGFSTVDAVTSLSGRGVGMDVVRNSIRALRGSVQMTSGAGQGTTVRLRLPLTLAIIDGLQVKVGDATCVIPLDMVEECVHFEPDTGCDLIRLRGNPLPFTRLGDLFSIGVPSAARQSVVVVRHMAQRAGLVVDALLGSSQTVIKPMGRVFEGVAGVAGSSILGSGEVALILDVPSLLRRVKAAEEASTEISTAVSTGGPEAAEPCVSSISA